LPFQFTREIRDFITRRRKIILHGAPCGRRVTLGRAISSAIAAPGSDAVTGASDRNRRAKPQGRAADPTQHQCAGA
jgi:hypothetical protein